MILVQGANISGKKTILSRIMGTCAVMAALFMTTATQAWADNTFLLQLGSSDSESSANSMWDEIKSKNADIVGGLTLHIAQVALPPSNDVSYRIQVGPLNSRDKAANACTQLLSRDVQCYVVETAMYAPESISEEAPAEKETTKAAAPAPSAAPSAALEAAPAPVHPHPHVVASSDEDASHADDPDYIPSPVDSGPVIISTSEVPAATPTASPVETAEVPVTPAPAPARHPVAHAPNVTTVASVPPAPAPAPVQEKPGFFSRLFGSSPPKPAAATGVVGSVKVAEAVRVPLSTDKQPQQKIVPVFPSSGGGDNISKTYWAQVNYFRDEAQALTFYRQFSTAYPQYADGARIRITRPFGSGNAPRITLRVGPFYGTDDVRAICGVATRWQARCTVVRDIAASAAVAPVSAPVTRADVSDTGQSYWAQLGSFHSTEEAWDAWRDLKSTHRKLVNHLRPSVVAPPASSAAGALFRLRAGPMALNKASATCGHLQDAGVDCVVVNER